MQSSNRRIVFSAPQTVEVQQEEVGSGDLGADELLIESLYSAVSAGTELACLAGLEEWFPFPGVPGYATVGRIVALGSSRAGDRRRDGLGGPEGRIDSPGHSSGRGPGWLQQTGRLQMHKLITHVVRPEDAPAVYDALATRKDEYVRVVFDWS